MTIRRALPHARILQRTALCTLLASGLTVACAVPDASEDEEAIEQAATSTPSASVTRRRTVDFTHDPTQHRDCVRIEMVATALGTLANVKGRSLESGQGDRISRGSANSATVNAILGDGGNKVTGFDGVAFDAADGHSGVLRITGMATPVSCRNKALVVGDGVTLDLTVKRQGGKFPILAAGGTRVLGTILVNAIPASDGGVGDDGTKPPFEPDISTLKNFCRSDLVPSNPVDAFSTEWKSTGTVDWRTDGDASNMLMVGPPGPPTLNVKDPDDSRDDRFAVEITCEYIPMGQCNYASDAIKDLANKEQYFCQTEVNGVMSTTPSSANFFPYGRKEKFDVAGVPVQFKITMYDVKRRHLFPGFEGYFEADKVTPRLKKIAAYECRDHVGEAVDQLKKLDKDNANVFTKTAKEKCEANPDKVKSHCVKCEADSGSGTGSGSY